MIRRPCPGQLVELRYRPALRPLTGLHGARGVVCIAGRGPGPINALVELECGRLVVVPRGHLVVAEPMLTASLTGGYGSEKAPRAVLRRHGVEA